ncbi:hypothetical protein S40288_05775, partial [Stachybotrys chartarum IBT 40288]
ASGRTCTYRPTPTSLETDLAVLSRLAEVEGRLQTLEEVIQMQQQQEHAAANLPLPPTVPAPMETNSLPDLDSNLATPPEIHTAAAVKMLYGWPRIRLNLSRPSPPANGYLEEFDEQDPLLLQTGASMQQPAQDTTVLLFWHSAIPDSAIAIDFAQMPALQLLIISLALRCADASSFDVEDTVLLSIASKAITASLQEAWKTLSSTEEERILLGLLTAYTLVFFWARPFHALGCLQSTEPLLENALRKKRDEPDLSTEAGGPQTPLTHHIASMINTTDPSSVGLGSPQSEAFLDRHVWLRCHLNKILTLLYGPSKAYAQPYELADVDQNLSARLRRWYASLPASEQFVRDSVMFAMAVPDMSMHATGFVFLLAQRHGVNVSAPEQRHSSLGQRVMGSRVMPGLHRERGDADPILVMLFAAYLVLLQVRPVTALYPILQSIGNSAGLLDSVERMFEQAPVESLKVSGSLELLRQQRTKFQTHSPF